MAVIIYKNTNVGNITPLSELLVVDTIEQLLPQSDLSNIELIESGFSSDQRQELLIKWFSDLIATKDQPLG